MMRRVAWSLPVALTICSFYRINVVSGRSMQPVLNPDHSAVRDSALFDRLAIKLNKYKRGDIVSLWSPTNANRMLVKRVVALEGDTIETLPPYPEPKVTVPSGHCWVEGDEPFNSTDSNSFGPVPIGYLDAKLQCIVWPLSRIGPLRTPPADKLRSLSNPQSRREMAEIERDFWRRSRVTPRGDI